MVESTELSKNELLDRARCLIDELEKGNMSEANKLLDDLTTVRESGLFKDIGKLTRELHDSISSFHLDVKFSQFTETDIPDAKERLNYVIDMTDKSAHRTLTAVENTLPIAGDLKDSSTHLVNEWKRFLARNMPYEEFKPFSKKIGTFLEKVENDSDQLKEKLSEVLMAQDFQDLTGQIIRRVISLVTDVEDNLVNLIKITGGQKIEGNLEDKDILEGPILPEQKKDKTYVAGQDEVDDLLSSLGF